MYVDHRLDDHDHKSFSASGAMPALKRQDNDDISRFHPSAISMKYTFFSAGRRGTPQGYHIFLDNTPKRGKIYQIVT
jgi:hypothetical protein